MVAADRVSGTGAAPESHTGASEHVAVHPEGRVADASQSLSVAGLDGIAGDALPVACIAVGKVASLARSARVEPRKSALGSLDSGNCIRPVQSPERYNYAFTKNDCAPLPYLGW
jgi:hypothetical protein